MEAVVAPERKPWYRILYVQVLIATALGIIVGRANPDFAKQLKPLGDGFVSLIKMLIGPVIFCTVVHGIASMGDLKRVGRLGAKTLLYFEVVSTFALVIGLVVVNLVKPGAGFTPAGQTFHAAEKAVQTSSEYIDKAHSLSVTDFFVKLIPKTLISPFVEGDILQVLLVAILVAFALGNMRGRGERILTAIDGLSELLFGVIRIVVKLAPIGAFGAMGFTVGQYGLQSLGKLGALMGCFYITSALFIVIVLGVIARLCGFSIFRFIAYIKDELLLVLGTSSSETALPGMLAKMQRLGCPKSTVGLVIPTGYSFNLDGTNIYMAMAAIFLAQATNTPLDLGQQLALLAVAMLTSKGASGITGAGFITLAATLQAVHGGVPVESVAILVGIDRFMSECRALTNLVGNGVATIVISRWEGEVSAETINANMAATA